MARLRVTWDEWEQRRYLPARMEVIHSRLGGIDAQALRSLAQATRGCDSHALADVIEQFQRGGSLPVVRGDAAPIDIATDEVCEGMTGINTILHELAAAGFKAHAYPAMRESRRSALFQSLARAAPALFLKLHVFDDNTVFVATKSRH